MPLKLILDTNLVVSAFLNPDGLERLILNLALSDQVVLFISPEIFAEYEEMLYRKKFNIDSTLLKTALSYIRGKAILIKPELTVSASPDPDDNKFLACAETASADYIVTGNKRHFPDIWKRTRVVNARELIEIITPDLKA